VNVATPWRHGGARTFDDPIERWASVGPYYAMFPVQFAFDVVRKYSDPGDSVLDPFAGRASSIYAAAALGRVGFGVEISPVGWLYGSVKLNPATQSRVLARLRDVADDSRDDAVSQRARMRLPSFFESAYSPRPLMFLVHARRTLDWRHSRVDATLMTFILIYLHGKRGASFSNQMRDGKAMSPDYSVAWWKRSHLRPPDVDPLAFLTKRINWRYRHGRPSLDGQVRLGDSCRVLTSLSRSTRRAKLRRFDLLFTSPPYSGVTNYHYDQWLRGWMLGGSATPQPAVSVDARWKSKFNSRADYSELLGTVFDAASRLMTRRAAVYVRTDAREFTLESTMYALASAFPGRRIHVRQQPLRTRSQTALFGDKSIKPGEVDLIINRR
jgi:hypothetical protein